MLHTITLYMKTENDVYGKVSVEFSKIPTEQDLEQMRDAFAKSLIKVSGDKTAVIVSKQEYEENMEE